MPTVTLSVKIFSESQKKLVEEHLKASLRGLKVKIEDVKVTPRGWIQATVSGEDEKAALSHLDKTVGLCPIGASDLKKFSTLRGYITSVGKTENQLYLDVGLKTSKAVNVIIPLKCLQAQLADGRRVAMKKLAELYGFCENTSLTTKLTHIGENILEGMIAENQLKLYKKWIKYILDRLIALGVTQQEIRTALKNARCHNDIVEIEQLGLFEHAIVCKLGTDAVGLIPKIGKNLRNATLSIFSPKKILELLPDQ